MNWFRNIAVTVCVIAGAVSHSISSGAISPAVRLAATALIMGGTNQVFSIPPSTSAFIRNYVVDADTNFIAPTGLCVGGDPGCTLVALYTPEQLKFITGINDMTFDESVAVGQANLEACIRGSSCVITVSPYVQTGAGRISDDALVVTGQSQSAVIASSEKSHLVAHPPVGTTVSMVLLSNLNRPNGGVFERFVGAYIPFLGITFNGATVTNSPQPTPVMTADFAQQYDLWCDFPTNPLNLLADLNAVLGATFLHADYQAVATPALLQGVYQDTTYYLHPTPILPLLMPLAGLPFLGMPLALAADAPLRVLVETGYDRTINPGQPTPAKYLYFPDPIATLLNVVRAIPTGWDDSISYIAGNPLYRPFGTSPQPVYGVGGPPVYAGAVDPYSLQQQLNPVTVATESPAKQALRVAGTKTNQAAKRRVTSKAKASLSAHSRARVADGAASRSSSAR